MKVLINSEPREFSGKNISELISFLDLKDTTGIALAVNETVIPKSEWEKFQLKNNDKVIIIKATAGG